jgi:hypothetical protein
MLAKVFSCAVIGLDGAIVEVEVDTSNGLPSFVDVGSDSQYGSPLYGKVSKDSWPGQTWVKACLMLSLAQPDLKVRRCQATRLVFDCRTGLFEPET